MPKVVTPECVYNIWLTDFLKYVLADGAEAEQLKSSLVTLIKNMDCDKKTAIWDAEWDCIKNDLEKLSNIFQQLLDAYGKDKLAILFNDMWTDLTNDQLNQIGKLLKGRVVPAVCNTGGLENVVTCASEDQDIKLYCLRIKISTDADNTVTIGSDGGLYTPFISACDSSIITDKDKNCVRVQISSDDGNQLQVRSNGLYYGVVAPQDVANLYVSLSGNDGNNGTADSPLATIDAALQKIMDRNAAGSYTIFLNAGQSFTLSKGYSFGTPGVSITIQYYNDPLFGQYTGLDTYRPAYSTQLTRPTMIWDTYYQLNNGVSTVQAGGISGGSSFQLYLRGINLTIRNSAGATSGGGWFFYISYLGLHGCDITLEGESQGLGSATNIMLFKNNFYRTNDSVKYFISDNTPQFFINDSGMAGTVVKDPTGEYPDITLRSQNQYEALTVDSICAMTEYVYNDTTKTGTLFGFGCNWNIFAASKV